MQVEKAVGVAQSILATRYGTEVSGIESWLGRGFTCPADQPRGQLSLLTMGTGSFPVVKRPGLSVCFHHSIAGLQVGYLCLLPFLARHMLGWPLPLNVEKFEENSCLYLPVMCIYYSHFPLADPYLRDRLSKSKRISTRVGWLLVVLMLLSSAVSVAQSGGASVKCLVVQQCSSMQPWLNLRFHLTHLRTVARSQWGERFTGWALKSES